MLKVNFDNVKVSNDEILSYKERVENIVKNSMTY